MRHSRSFIKFATIICVACVFVSCKGRTLDNVEPTGDTVEVVIATPTSIDQSTITSNE